MPASHDYKIKALLIHISIFVIVAYYKKNGILRYTLKWTRQYHFTALNEWYQNITYWKHIFCILHQTSRYEKFSILMIYTLIFELHEYVIHFAIELIVCNLLILNSYVYKAISSFPIQTNYQLYPFELHLWRKRNSFCYNEEWCNYCLVHAFILDHFFPFETSF